MRIEGLVQRLHAGVGGRRRARLRLHHGAKTRISTAWAWLEAGGCPQMAEPTVLTGPSPQASFPVAQPAPRGLSQTVRSLHAGPAPRAQLFLRAWPEHSLNKGRRLASVSFKRSAGHTLPRAAV